ncbi:MAG: hypothetical protein ACRCY4_08045, partial [Brevinema sp.]
MTQKDKKPHFSIHISQKTLRFMFRCALVYILFLGIVNIGLYLAKPAISSAIKNALSAKEVRISGISNVPFIFISISSIDIVIDDEIKAELRDVYFRYRLWNIITRKWELVPASFTINKASVEFHTFALKAYQKRLAKQYPSNPDATPRPETPASPISFDLAKMIFDVRIRNIAATVRAMGHYRVDTTVNSAYATIKDNTADWRADLNV